MPSQTDLDQGGSARVWEKVYLGPSVGWVNAPSKNMWGGGSTNTTSIVNAGTYQLDLATNFVQVRCLVGQVTLILPSAKNPIPAVTIPGQSVGKTITIVDVGGTAGTTPIIIQPLTGSGETIMNLAQIQIAVNFGFFALEPSNIASGWVNAG